MNCYEAIDLMGDALEGRLGAELRAGLKAHLEECAPCSNYFDQLRLTRRALENLPPPSETNQRVLLHRGRARIRRAIDRYLREGVAAPSTVAHDGWALTGPGNGGPVGLTESKPSAADASRGESEGIP